MTGVYGGIVIDPASGQETVRADRDHTVLLSDWTDEDPMRVLTKLKVQGDYYNYNQPTVVDFFRDASRDGLKQALDKRSMWNQMRMSPTDLADLSSATLTHLPTASRRPATGPGCSGAARPCACALSTARATPSTTCVSPG